MGFDDKRTDEFDDNKLEDDDIEDEFETQDNEESKDAYETPEEAKDFSLERQKELQREVYPKTFN